jgi:hypothetical protein
LRKIKTIFEKDKKKKEEIVWKKGIIRPRFFKDYKKSSLILPIKKPVASCSSKQ